MNNQDYKALWDEAYRQIKEEFTQQGKSTDFSIWFNMDFCKASDNKFSVYVPSEFMWQRILSLGYKEMMEKKLSSLVGQQIIIDSYQLKSNFNSISVVEQTNSSSQQTTSESSPIYQQSPFSATQNVPHNTQTAQVSAPLVKHPQLKEEFNFDTFVAGENSTFAYNVALAASNNPGKSYNPILIYGGVGLGKTHLMQSIGNKLYKERGEKFKITYINAENFTNEFTTAIRTSTTDQFKSKYRKMDLLLLDDIHFLIGKPGVQEELFNTFESLSQKNAQMVFTCDRPITELKGIEDRLKSRFSSGICIDLQPPNYETRCAIIQRKLEILNQTLAPEVIDYLAKTVLTNVRDLEACLKKSLAYAELMQEPLTIEIASKLFGDTLNSPSSENLTIDTIQKVVADYYNISVSDIKSKKRDQKFANPRHIAVYITRNLTEFALPEIGNEFGGRDHTTIMHSIDKIETLLKTDSSLSSTIEMLIRNIKEYRK